MWKTGSDDPCERQFERDPVAQLGGVVGPDFSFLGSVRVGDRGVVLTDSGPVLACEDLCGAFVCSGATVATGHVHPVLAADGYTRFRLVNDPCGAGAAPLGTRRSVLRMAAGCSFGARCARRRSAGELHVRMRSWAFPSGQLRGNLGSAAPHHVSRELPGDGVSACPPGAHGLARFARNDQARELKSRERSSRDGA